MIAAAQLFRRLTHVIAIGWTSVRPSLAGIVSKTAQPVIKLSSLPGSFMILVFWGPYFSRNSSVNTPNGGFKCKGNTNKVAISDQNLAIARKRLWIDGYMLLCVWPALNPLFIHVTFIVIVPGAYPGEGKMYLRLIAETDALLAIAILLVLHRFNGVVVD